MHIYFKILFYAVSVYNFMHQFKLCFFKKSEKVKLRMHAYFCKKYLSKGKPFISLFNCYLNKKDKHVCNLQAYKFRNPFKDEQFNYIFLHIYQWTSLQLLHFIFYYKLQRPKRDCNSTFKVIIESFQKLNYCIKNIVKKMEVGRN